MLRVVRPRSLARAGGADQPDGALQRRQSKAVCAEQRLLVVDEGGEEGELRREIASLLRSLTASLLRSLAADGRRRRTHERQCEHGDHLVGAEGGATHHLLLHTAAA